MHRQQRFRESGELYRIATQLHLEEYTERHHDICCLFLGIAQGVEGQGQLEEAAKYYRLVAERAKSFLGAEHRTTMGCNYRLGRLLRKKGHLQESKELLFATVKIQIRALGEDHLKTLWSMYEIGRVLYEEGKYKESEGWLTKCFQRSLKTLGPWYKLTTWSCKHLGICHEGEQRYTDALAIYHDLLEELLCNHPTISKIQERIEVLCSFIEEEQTRKEGSDLRTLT